MKPPYDTRRRKHGHLTYVRRILRQVWAHPSNRKRRWRALVETMAWQIRKRLFHAPMDMTVFGGLSLRCYPDSSSASGMIYASGLPEYHEMRFAQRFLRPGDGFIDGGANIGIYTLLAASRIGPTGRIDAFEPSPRSFQRLQENVDLNALEQVYIHAAALDQASGIAHFLADWDVSNRLVLENDDRPGTIDVDCVRLDDVLPDRAYAMAKLDLEGAELRALRGAIQHLREANPPVWQVELTESQLAKQDASLLELKEFLEDSGFTLEAYDADENTLSRLDLSASTHPPNGFAIARKARNWVEKRLLESSDPQRL